MQLGHNFVQFMSVDLLVDSGRRDVPGPLEQVFPKVDVRTCPHQAQYCQIC